MGFWNLVTRKIATSISRQNREMPVGINKSYSDVDGGKNISFTVFFA